MNISIGNIIKYSFFTAITLAVLYFVFKDIDFAVLWNDIKHMNIWWVILSLVFATLGYISRAIRWVLLIETLGHTPSFKNSFTALMFGYFANLAIPRIGEVARCGVLHKQENIPVNKLIGTVVIERLSDLFMLFLIAMSVLLLKYDFLGGFLKEHVFDAAVEKVETIPLSYVIITTSLLSIIGILLIVSKNKFSFSRKATNFVKGIVTGMKSVFSMKKRVQFIAHTVFIWLMYWAMTYVVFFAIPYTAHLSASDGLFILIVGGLGMTAPVQSGMGVFHWIVGQALLLYGLDFATQGIVFATISHGSQTLLVLILGIISIVTMSKPHSHAKK